MLRKQTSLTFFVFHERLTFISYIYIYACMHIKLNEIRQLVKPKPQPFGKTKPHMCTEKT